MHAFWKVISLSLKSWILYSGNIKVFCRTRPLFEDEGRSVVEFPDECTIRVNTSDDAISNPKKDFEFDRVYGPHVGQGEHKLSLWVSFSIIVSWFYCVKLFYIGPYSSCVWVCCLVSLGFCMQLNCLGMFSHWCSQLWMDIMFLYLLMAKPTQEKHTQWLSLFLSICLSG